MNNLKEQITKSKDTRCDWSSPEGPLYLDIDPDRVGPGGSLYWHHRENGSLHRDGAPAVLGADGSKHWYQHGKLHRDGGPAMEQSDGTKHWYRYGKLHRDGGPAMEQRNSKLWYQHGKIHRDDGPAVEYASGTLEWYQYDQLHREDGPAIQHQNGTHRWYLNGQQLDFDEWLDRVTDSDKVKFRLALRWAGLAEEPA